jgi:hypothetical protein
MYKSRIIEEMILWRKLEKQNKEYEKLSRTIIPLNKYNRIYIK